MKWIGALCLLALLSLDCYAQTPVPAGVQQLANKRVLVLGDSNTQNGMYLSFIEYFLQKTHPELQFDIVNAGLASETASGLTEDGHPGPRPCIHERLDRALADAKPKLVMACYGMNDGIYKPLDPERTQSFRDGINQLVKKCQAAGAEVILITPPAFDVDCQGGIEKNKFDYNTVLDAYAEWELTTRPGGATVIDLHVPMSAVVKPMKAAHPLHRQGDGVHPTDMGHFVMAHAILKGLGQPLPEGNLPEQFVAVQADPLFKLIRQRQSARAHGWLNYIGFTRVNKTTPPHENDIAEVEKNAAELQVQIDRVRNEPSR
jgi:lysophospholipase L1-like esterase